MVSNEQRLLKTTCNHLNMKGWVTILQHKMLPLGGGILSAPSAPFVWVNNTTWK